MRALCKAMIAAAFLGSLSSPSAAQPLDGNAYLTLCQSQDIGMQNGCSGFGAGLISALMFWNSIPTDQGGPSAKFCVPPGVQTVQAMDVVQSYVSGHPETRHYLAGMLAQLALMEAFPC